MQNSRSFLLKFFKFVFLIPIIIEIIFVFYLLRSCISLVCPVNDGHVILTVPSQVALAFDSDNFSPRYAERVEENQGRLLEPKSADSASSLIV
jgi:hypothetical protein